MKKVLFVHRSVGKNLLKDGHLAELVQEKSHKAGIEIDFKDINNNEQKGVPGGDTKPNDYLKYFANNSRDEDLVIIKSCYPNSAIKSDTELTNLKDTYQKIADEFTKNSPGKLLIMTTPPLRRGRTNYEQAHRARELATWLTKLSSTRVSVFDFYSLLAASGKSSDANTLKKEYRRIAPWDNHPNFKANNEIAPLISQAVIDYLI